ncbi:MAG: DNA polymerase III subunit gamma/tau [Myxococcales bacterium]|nr:DNA polymerase III subunit gamma/tau [Myxococcales bacterium]
MSYLVLARKYRPQTFEQVIGQEHVTRTLQNAIRRGRIHHAYLFCGGRGTGKTTTARILAKALSCDQAPTPEPCNQCPACIEITQGTSVDVQEIDAASQNRVEDIRELRESIRYAPVRGKKKLYILDEVHMLSTSAFNALLKTLEEPPPHALFVFATTDPHKLPQTILSRVQRYDFKLVPTARLVEHLADVLTRESIEFDPAALYIIAREGAGSVRDSLSLLDQVLASTEGKLTEAQAAAVLGVADRRLIMALGQAVAGRAPETALSLLDDAFRRGFDLPQLARTLLSHLRDLVVVSVVKEPLPLLEVPASELPELEQQAKQVAGRSELLFDRMMRIAEDTARATQARYALEVGLVELCTLEPLQPIAELVDRLEQIEDRLTARPLGRSVPPGSSGPVGPPSGPPPSSGGPRGPVPQRGMTAAPPGEATYPMPTTPRGASMERPIAVAPPARTVAALAPVAASVSGSPPAIAEHLREPQAAAMPSVPPAALPPPQSTQPQPVAQPPPPVEEKTAPPLPSSAVSMPVDSSAASGPRTAAALPAPAAPIADDPAEPIPTASSAPTRDFASLVRKVTEQAPVLAYLREARVLQWDGTRLTIGLASPFDVLRSKDERPRLQELFNKAAGEALVLDFVLDAQATKDAAERETLAATEERARQAELARRRREASEHPALKLIREVFGEVSLLEPELDSEVPVHG